MLIIKVIPYNFCRPWSPQIFHITFTLFYTISYSLLFVVFLASLLVALYSLLFPSDSVHFPSQFILDFEYPPLSGTITFPSSLYTLLLLFCLADTLLLVLFLLLFYFIRALFFSQCLLRLLLYLIYLFPLCAPYLYVLYRF